MPARVALESTVIAHGLPHPDNLRLAERLERVVRARGAEPHTMGIVDGTLVDGLSSDQLALLATAPHVRKVSLRDIPIAVAQRAHGATTVAATMWMADRAGIAVFATGGIGGVHRAPGGRLSSDVSNDLDALGRFPVAVVCAGPKAILDLPATREALETRGVTLVGYRTDTMPGFYFRETDLPVDVRCDTPEEVAAIVRARRDLGLAGATLVVAPVPEDAALPREEVEPAIEAAVRTAEREGIAAAALTPYLLRAVAAHTGNRSLATNLALLENNAGIAADLAVALAAT